MTSVMDPQSIPFTPRDDIWRFHSEMLRVQQTQAEHADRLSRLERRQDEDARVKSVWGTSSPFPSVLGGTPQQVPLQQPNSDAFSTFDDQSSNLIGSLHLDPEEEPRRLGATSRANSVRFDETANQGHWSHASRVSMDLIPRTGSSLGGHPMTERSYSHKSDGRQSSAAASVHSATSGRANSLGIDTTFPGDASTLDVPRIAPGLFFLGTVPAVIRCWLNTSFKHDSLLYAAVCSGSYTSSLDMKLIEKLGYEGQIVRDDEGTRKIKLELYLPEAVPYPASSRASSPTPQLPSLKVDFTVVESYGANSKAIKVVLGSDLLRHHSADILFSSNSMILFDDERNKLSVPLVRPEDESTFKTLQTSTHEQRVVFSQDFDGAPGSSSRSEGKRSPMALEGLKQASPTPAAQSNDRHTTVAFSEDDHVTTSDRRSLPGSSQANRLDQNKDVHSDSDHTPARSQVSRSDSSSSAIWGNWRRIESEKSDSTTPTTTADWASLGRNSQQGVAGGGTSTNSSNTYQRRDTGIKVLKPIRTQSRNPSVASGAGGPPSAVSTPTTTTGGGASSSSSRFFDEGRRRVTSVSSAAGGGAAGWGSGQARDGGEQPGISSSSSSSGPKRAISVSEVVKGGGGAGGGGTAKDASAGSGKPAGPSKQNQNPVGGASAFAWLNSAGGGGAGVGGGGAAK
ncbi:uncharacterized protein IWZ02DRAFT_181811 [Phyllosticta citriasiana]|uniref:Ubiquitin carboxyl-terminal hydrolase 19 n=1 Tax=Phyllosticta citriasiana TaxID=595635 RepID=A0ABR1KJ08_9PEZI